MLNKILCFLGFHDWDYSSMAVTNDIKVLRRDCYRCKKAQEFDEGTKIGLEDRWWNIKEA
jgi:hypothetical protein